MSDDDRSAQRESETGTDPRHDTNDSSSADHEGRGASTASSRPEASSAHEGARDSSEADAHPCPSTADDTSGVDETVAHPCPWSSIDYRAARPTDSEWQDRGTPPGIPEPMSGQTTFNPDDAPPSERDHYQWLAKQNQGVGGSDRGTAVHYGGLERDLGVVVSRLDATDRQEERAEWLLERIDVKDEILTCGPIELAVLAVVSLAIDEDRTRFAHHDGAKAKSVLRDTAFNRLCDEFDLEKREVRRVRQRVRETDVYESPNS